MRRLPATLVFGLMLLFGSVYSTQAATRPSITRAETVALLVDSYPQLQQRLQWYIKNMPPLPLYKDADPKAWYGPYLETAFEAGIIMGGDSFRPRSPVTAEEAAAMLLRARSGNQQPEVVLAIPGSRVTWVDVVLADAYSAGIALPRPLRLGTPLSQNDLYTMMRSAGIGAPERIALSINPSQGYLPKPVVVAQLQPLPSATRPVQTAQVTQPRPVQTTPTPTPVSNEFTVSIPTAGISKLTVTHPSDPFTSKGLLEPLQKGVGHLFTYPGNPGKILIYGHSSSYPWDTSAYTKIFRQINKVNVGDKVYVNYEGVQHTYEVTYKQAVPAGDMSAYQSTGEEELILYTCWPPDSISQRYLVHAKPV